MEDEPFVCRLDVRCAPDVESPYCLLHFVSSKKLERNCWHFGFYRLDFTQTWNSAVSNGVPNLSNLTWMVILRFVTGIIVLRGIQLLTALLFLMFVSVFYLHFEVFSYFNQLIMDFNYYDLDLAGIFLNSFQVYFS